MAIVQYTFQMTCWGLFCILVFVFSLKVTWHWHWSIWEVRASWTCSLTKWNSISKTNIKFVYVNLSVNESSVGINCICKKTRKREKRTSILCDIPNPRECLITTLINDFQVSNLNTRHGEIRDFEFDRNRGLLIDVFCF